MLRWHYMTAAHSWARLCTGQTAATLCSEILPAACTMAADALRRTQKQLWRGTK